MVNQCVLEHPNNCYGIVLNNDMICNNVRLDKTDLWHQRLGHINYRDLSNASKVVEGIPKLEKVDNQVCALCQMG